jgi:hypothetical protein
MMAQTAGLLAGAAVLPSWATAAEGASIYDLTALQYGEETSLSKFKGQVTVVLNIASE